MPCCIGLVLVSTLLEGLGDPVFYLALQSFSVEFAIGRRRPLGGLAVSASTRLCVSTEQRAASSESLTQRSLPTYATVGWLSAGCVVAAAAAGTREGPLPFLSLRRRHSSRRRL